MKKFILRVSTVVFICSIFVSCKNEEGSQLSIEEKDNWNVVEEQQEEQQEEKQEEKQKEKQEEKQEENSKIEVSIEIIEDNRERKDENGIIMLSITENYPVITIKDREEASNRINKYYQLAREVFHITEEEYFAYALEEYAISNEDIRENWNGYGLGKSYEIARVDEKVISIIENGYEYAGGAHPNSYKLTQNFNTETGDSLSLEDISIDEDKDDYQDEDYDDPEDFIEEYLISYIERSEYIDYVYPDFRDNLGDIIEDNSWYFSEDGIVIIANPYIIAPYAAGIMEFTIPYEDAVFLKEIYKLK